MPTDGSTPTIKLIGTPDNGLLLYLVADLMRDGALQAQFLANAQAVMNKFGLTAQARAVLFTMRADLIGSHIDKEFQIDGQILGTVPAWPGPNPHLDAITPDRAAAGAKVTVTISGEGLLGGADVLLVPPGGGTPLTVAQGRAVQNPAAPGGGTDFRHLALTATLDLSAVPPAAYGVRVRNSPDVPVLGDLDNVTFTIT